MIGHVIDGRYRIERRIGKGGFAEVFSAHDDKLGIDVAVKILSDSGKDNEFRKRFLRETASTAKLMSNSHIVTVLDCGELDTKPYFVMELVQGVTLKEFAEKASPKLPDVLRLSQQVCEAMAHAHANGVIHRDLSLNNVMVDVKGNVKILDFGLARLEGSTSMTDRNVLMGTRHHLAPEHLSGDAVDGLGDIFAFGVCLYYVLNNRFPFDAEHPASVNYLIQHDDPDPFEENVPFDVRDVVLKCLEKNPASRFQKFEEIEKELGLLTKQYHTSGIRHSAYQTIERSVRTRSSKRNPYLNRAMIKNPDDFFGREREVNRIFSRLDAEFPQSISVVGERGLGKSSLLNYVYQRRNRRQHMQNYHNAIFVYMDFQRGSAMDITRFINVLFGMFEYEKHDAKALSSGKKTLDTLRDVIEELSAKGKRIIVLMDEFDAITTNPNFDMQFFSFLRFLANNYKVAYVTSSHNDLQQMCHDKEIADSPFFNIFSNLPLRPFSRKEAVEIITTPSEHESIPLTSYTEQILELSGLFPLFVQMACSNAFEHLIEQDGGEPDWREITRSFVDEVAPHYSFVWENMDGNARSVVAQIASGKAVDRKLHHVSEELLRLGYLVDTDGRTSVFSRTFGEFVLEHAGTSPAKKSLWGKLLGR
jgi:serine/threonine protein kinase